MKNPAGDRFNIRRRIRPLARFRGGQTQFVPVAAFTSISLGASSSKVRWRRFLIAIQIDAAAMPLKMVNTADSKHPSRQRRLGGYLRIPNPTAPGLLIRCSQFFASAARRSVVFGVPTREPEILKGYVVHDDFEAIPAKDCKRITRAADKQFVSLADFQENASIVLAREIAAYKTRCNHAVASSSACGPAVLLE